MLKDRFAELIEHASRGACFCVILIGAVAQHLGMKTERPSKKARQRVSKADLVFLTIQLARSHSIDCSIDHVRTPAACPPWLGRVID